MHLLVLKTGALSRATYEWGEMIICPLIWVALIYCALKGGGRDRGGGDKKRLVHKKTGVRSIVFVSVPYNYCTLESVCHHTIEDRAWLSDALL